MKTTVEIDDNLLRAAKRVADERHMTLRQLIESGLRRELAASQSGIAWVAATGPWPAKLDLSSREAMWAWISLPEGTSLV